jgi:nitroreductase / dihydropteridine reductase
METIEKVLSKFTPDKLREDMSTIHSLEWRYATKKFDETKMLPQDKIDILRNAFNLTATSYGLQPIKLILISDKKLQKKLLPFTFNQNQVYTASHVLVLCIEKRIDKNYIEEYFKMVHRVRATPEEILTPFRDSLVVDFENRPEQEIKAWATNQAYLAMGTLLTVCAAEKIDSCPIEGFEPEKYDDILNLDKLNLESVLVLPVGYRAEDDMFSEFKKVRKEVTDTVIELPKGRISN